MFVVRFLVVFLILPLVLVITSYALSVSGRFWLLFVVCPGALILFALIQFLRDHRGAVPDEEAEAWGAEARTARSGRRE